MNALDVETSLDGWLVALWFGIILVAIAVPLVLDALSDLRVNRYLAARRDADHVPPRVPCPTSSLMRSSSCSRCSSG